MHWFYEPEFSTSNALSSETQKHLASLRISSNEPFMVTDGMGHSWQVLADPSGVIEVSVKIEHPAPAIKFTLIQALAKSDRDELAIQAAIELGASAITPWQARRSIVRWDGKAERNQNRWQSIAMESMKQSQRAFLPIVHPLAQTKQLSAQGVSIVLDPRAKTTLEMIPASSEYSIAVGPEGGLEPGELETLIEKGFIPVRLGIGVLRASNAGPAAIAALQLLHGEFRS